MMYAKQNRRNFLRFATLSGLGIASNPLSILAGTKLSPQAPLLAGRNQQKISILQTTDIHCQIHPHDEMFWENEQKVFRKTGGYAHLASFFERVRAENPNSFIVDTGDMFQGSQLSVETTGKAMIPILNHTGYDLYLPGNWEVVYGKKNMESLLNSLEAPTICSNMFHDAGNGEAGELIFKPYKVWEKAGIRIGFLGYTDPLVPLRQSPDYSRGIVYQHPAYNIKELVNKLKVEERCDIIILLSHLGLSQQIALANHPDCEGVDYIFGGDTHERVRKPIQCRFSKVVEPGAFGSFVGRLDLIVENGKVVDQQYRLEEVNPDQNPPQPVLASIIESTEQAFREQIGKIVGYSSMPLYRYFVVENTIDTLIINALKWKIKTDIVLSNGFRFCPPRVTPDHTGNIPITNGYIFDMLPVNSRVRMGKVTGQQISDWLEKELNNVFSKEASKRLGGWVVKFKGMHVEFAAFEEPGNRVKKISVAGKPLDPNKSYSICACEREGDPEDMLCRMKNVSDTKNSKYSLHETLISYIRKHSPVKPIPEGNAIILDAPSTLLTQVHGVDYSFI